MFLYSLKFLACSNRRCFLLEIRDALRKPISVTRTDATDHVSDVTVAVRFEQVAAGVNLRWEVVRFRHNNTKVNAYRLPRLWLAIIGASQFRCCYCDCDVITLANASRKIRHLCNDDVIVRCQFELVRMCTRERGSNDVMTKRKIESVGVDDVNKCSVRCIVE